MSNVIDMDIRQALSVLGIDQETSVSDARAAYRQLAKKHHPDKGGTAERFRQIQAAWEVVEPFLIEKEKQATVTAPEAPFAGYDVQRHRVIYNRVIYNIRTPSTATQAATDSDDSEIWLLYDDRCDVYLRNGVQTQTTGQYYGNWIPYKKVDDHRYLCLEPDRLVNYGDDMCISKVHIVLMGSVEHLNNIGRFQKSAARLK